ncbi:MAG: hypothetical protein ABIS86_08645 [Streptosporangiaceae bacterium]
MSDQTLVIVVLASVAVAITLYFVVRALRRLFRLRKVALGPEAPTTAKAAYWLAWIYTLSPIDVLPDPILIDDVGVVLAAIATIERVTRKQRTGLLQKSGSGILER